MAVRPSLGVVSILRALPILGCALVWLLLPSLVVANHNCSLEISESPDGPWAKELRAGVGDAFSIRGTRFLPPGVEIDGVVPGQGQVEWYVNQRETPNRHAPVQIPLDGPLVLTSSVTEADVGTVFLRGVAIFENRVVPCMNDTQPDRDGTTPWVTLHVAGPLIAPADDGELVIFLAATATLIAGASAVVLARRGR